MSNDTQHEDISVLNELTSLCLDSARGYREAATQGKDSTLAETFESRAAERDRVASELQEEVRSMGGTPAEHGTIAGSAHRVMLDVRTMLGDNAKAAIDEVERGEDVIKGRFEKAMSRDDISMPVKTLISRCYSSIREGHDEMAALKRATN
jgi:uncharacterized protein (TIGR02284 family)